MQHLAIIMDGNRRWVRKQGFTHVNQLDGGATSLEAAVACCLTKKIPYLTVYALSIENLKRADATLSDLYFLLNSRADELIEKLSKKGVEMRFVGDRSLFAPEVKESIERIEKATKGGKSLKINALFCYGGQQEIVATAQKLAEKVAAGELHPQQITQNMFENHLWTTDFPAPDLIIRSGGAKRLSNFLMYQAAYAEFAFLDALWPDVTQQDLEQLVDGFSRVQRNFGI